MNPSSKLLGTYALAAASSLASVAAVPALVAQMPAPTSTAMTGHAAADSAQSLVNFIATVNRDEIAAGQLAMSKATRADVKAYAQRMVEDHTNAMAAWAQKIPALSLTLPDSAKSVASSAQSKANTAAMANGISEVSDTTTRKRGGIGAAAIHSANVIGLEDLRKLNGTAFDAQYIQMQLDGHDAVLKELALRPITYTDLQTLLTTFRTTVENHQVAARKLKTTP